MLAQAAYITKLHGFELVLMQVLYQSTLKKRDKSGCVVISGGLIE